MSLFKITKNLTKSIFIGDIQKFHILNKKTEPYINYHLLIKSALASASQKTSSKEICWKCGIERKQIEKLFCEKCNIIQNPNETKDYFKLFDLKQQFNIDTSNLKYKYRKMQNDLHPDRFIQKSDEEKTISTNMSSLINKAYNNLLLPLKRAEHLLMLKGDKLSEDQVLVDEEFLMEIMELNEEVENCTDTNKLKKLNVENKTKLEELTLQIDECFKNEDLYKAKQLVIKMKYYSSLGNRINGLLREMGVTD